MDEVRQLQLSGSAIAAIGWFYLVTNSARVFAYIPQIIAVWRCQDGARAISLLTWGSWTVSHIAAIAYGVLVVHDVFFVVVSTINLIGCATITVIASRRRRRLLATKAPPVSGSLHGSDAAPTDAQSSRGGAATTTNDPAVDRDGPTARTRCVAAPATR